MSIANTIFFAVQCQLASTGQVQYGLSGASINLPIYTYNVTDLAGNALGTGMTPTKPKRPGVSYQPGGGIGSGYNDESGTFQLYDANEWPSGPAVRGPG